LSGSSAICESYAVLGASETGVGIGEGVGTGVGMDVGRENGMGEGVGDGGRGVSVGINVAVGGATTCESTSGFRIRIEASAPQTPMVSKPRMIMMIRCEHVMLFIGLPSYPKYRTRRARAQILT
jgi:hypothetical protein